MQAVQFGVVDTAGHLIWQVTEVNLCLSDSLGHCKLPSQETVDDGPIFNIGMIENKMLQYSSENQRQ